MGAITFDGSVWVAPVSCELPGGAGPLVPFTNPNGGFAGPFASPGDNVENGSQNTTLLAYLWQIWYLTCGWLNVTEIDGPTTISGTGNLASSTGYIRRIYFDFNKQSTVGKLRGFNPSSALFGWGQFTYNGFAGPLRYLNFQHCYLEPEAENADGFTYSIIPGLTCEAELWAMINPLPGISWTGGLTLNPDSGDLSGLGAGNYNFDTVFATETLSQKFIRVASHVLDNSTVGDHTYNFSAIASGINDGGAQAMLFALVNQIWEKVCHPSMGTTNSGAQTYTGPGVYSSGSNYIKSGQITIVPAITLPDYQFGLSGFPYLGNWAPVSGSYFGELRYFNGLQNQFCNMPLDTNGIWISVKPFAPATINFFETSSQLLNTDNTFGGINIKAGVVDGLLVNS